MVDRGCLDYKNNIQYLDNSIINRAPMDCIRNLSSDFTPCDMDVICSRGAESYNHPGNRRLRQLIHDNMGQYTQAKTKLEKSLIVTGILETIRSSSSTSYGFVRKVKHTGRWQAVSDKLSREKVGQGFRAAVKRGPLTKTEQAIEKCQQQQQQQQSSATHETTSTTTKRRRDWGNGGDAQGTVMVMAQLPQHLSSMTTTTLTSTSTSTSTATATATTTGSTANPPMPQQQPLSEQARQVSSGVASTTCRPPPVDTLQDAVAAVAKPTVHEDACASTRRVSYCDGLLEVEPIDLDDHHHAMSSDLVGMLSSLDTSSYGTKSVMDLGDDEPLAAFPDW